jgi:hypothetical protein
MEAHLKEITVEILQSPAAVAAIIAATLAFVSGVLGPLVQLCIGRRQARAAQTSANAAMLTARNAGSREIARMRLEWMNKLRDTLSEYHSILMTDDSDDEAQKLSLLGTQLDLLLNQEDAIQKALWDVTDKIFNCEDATKRQEMDEELIKAGRAVFKSEWEKIKAEMQGQDFQTGE